jgi:hypothetical protein
MYDYTLPNRKQTTPEFGYPGPHTTTVQTPLVPQHEIIWDDGRGRITPGRPDDARRVPNGMYF